MALLARDSELAHFLFRLRRFTDRRPGGHGREGLVNESNPSADTRFEDQQKAKIALAVKLGAKPPKNAYKNYKELIEEKKLEKAKAAEEAYIRTVGKTSSGRATVSCNKLTNRFTKQKKRAKDVTNLTQHYGVVNPKIHKKKRNK